MNQNAIIEKLKSILKIRGPRQIYLYSILIGFVSGMGTYLFSYLLAKAEYYVLGGIAGLETYHPPGEISFHHSLPLVLNPWMLLILPPIGGILTGMVTYFFCKDAIGTGTDAMINAFHQNEGRMNTRVPFFKSIASIITLASGGSAGKEGPITQIGAGFGVIIANLVGAGARARRTFLLAGMAAGLGSVFRAPLGAAITAVEVVYQEDIESDSLVPAIISAVTAYLFYTAIAGNGTIFLVDDVSLKDYHELLFYLFLGLLCFGTGFIFVKTFHWIGGIFQKLPVHPIIKPGIGGLLTGCIAFFVPQVVGSGFGLLQLSMHGRAFEPNLPLVQVAFLFLFIAFIKIIATSFTIGSGGSGGVFAPSLFIGGMLGGFVGSLAKAYFPNYISSIAPFILVGMSSFFAGVARAPIAGMIMVCDMIGSYALLPPLMIVSVLAFILSHRWSIYKGQAENRFHSPAHEWDMNRDIMDRISVSKYFEDFRKYAIIPKSMLLSDAEDLGLKIQASDFIVTNEDSSYYGVTSLRRFRLDAENKEFIKNLITVQDVSEAIPYITPTHTIGDALKIILSHDIDKIAVVKNGIVAGYLRYIDLLNAYHTELRNNSRPKGKNS